MDMSAVRAGLAANAATIAGLRCFAYIPDAIDPPVFIVAEYGIDFDKTFGRGLDEVTFTCWIRVPRASERAGQKQLDGYLAGSGALSLKSALESDKTLAGAAQTLRVEQVHGYGQYDTGEQQYFGASIDIRVWGNG